VRLSARGSEGGGVGRFLTLLLIKDSRDGHVVFHEFESGRKYDTVPSECVSATGLEFLTIK
jgi:hypothetical protein